MQKRFWYLDNKGWGLRTMIFCTSIFIFALLLIAILITRLSNQLSLSINPNKSTNNENNHKSSKEDYTKVENLMNIITKDYISEIYQSDIDIITVNLKQLKEFDAVDRLKSEMKNMDCIGYSNANKNGNEIIVKSYLKCTKYTTEGFNSIYID